MHQEIDDRRIIMVRGEYIGTDNNLYGQEALLLVYVSDENQPTGHTLKAQFDNKTLGELAYGWHVFLISEWEIQQNF